ncbi:MAG: hypothetical protein KME52_01875 [Desmonostoc geniculatum HA4340-LM1]|nr:hypothetical protein [Desmonostoc geniculatum HA4340-LM1]
MLYISKVRDTATVYGCSPAGGVKAPQGRSRYGQSTACTFVEPYGC